MTVSRMRYRPPVQNVTIDPRETVRLLGSLNLGIPPALRACRAVTWRCGCSEPMPMLPSLRENGTVFERRIPLAAEQVIAEQRPEIHSVLRVNRASLSQSGRTQSERRAGVSQQAFHATVRHGAKRYRYKRVQRPCSE